MIKLITVFKTFFRNTISPHKTDWIILIAISMILFISHIYSDILITTRQGINLWNDLFDGQIFNFYSNNLQTVSGNIVYTDTFYAAYDILSYFVFAIWNFPLWILEKFFNVDIMNSVLCIMWSKAMLIFFLALSAKVINKICIELKIKENTAKWCVYCYFSSAFIFSSLFVTSQYDIISLSFMLIGLLMYLKGNMKKFIFWFAIAITFKFFALFLFIPLILLKEKRILRIFKYFIGGISLTVLLKLIFIFDIATVTSSKYQISMLAYLSKNSLLLSIGTISIFYLLTALLYIFCYYKKINSSDELHKFSVYASFLAFAILFTCAYTYPYWVILFVPFTILLIFQNYDKIKVNLLIEITMTSSFIIAQMFEFSWCYGIKTIEPMLLSKIFGDVSSLSKVFSLENILSLSKVYTLKGIVLPALLAIFVACVIALAIINFPQNNKNEIDSEVKIDRGIIWARLAIGGGICLLTVAGYFASVVYNALSH